MKRTIIKYKIINGLISIEEIENAATEAAIRNEGWSIANQYFLGLGPSYAGIPSRPEIFSTNIFAICDTDNPDHPLLSTDGAPITPEKFKFAIKFLKQAGKRFSKIKASHKSTPTKEVII